MQNRQVRIRRIGERDSSLEAQAMDPRCPPEFSGLRDRGKKR